jgi:hypothetical protein
MSKVQEYRSVFSNVIAVLIILSVGALVACSTIMVVYSKADRILFRYMDEYLDLTTTQKEYLKPELQLGLDEHRREELPRFVELLDKVDEYGQDGVSEAEAGRILDLIVELYAATTSKTVAVVAPVLAQLNSAQIEHLSRKLDAANRRYYAKYLVYSEDRRMSRRAKRIVRRLERWTGALTSAQERLVTRLSDAIPDTYEDWYEYRIRQQQAILGMVRESAPSDRLERLLNRWWVEQDDISPQLGDKVEKTWDIISDMIVMVDRTLTTKQRDRVLRRVNDINRQFRSLVTEEDDQG